MTYNPKTLAVLMCTAAVAVLLSGCKPGAQQADAEAAAPPLAALPLTDASAPQGQPGPLAVDLPYARPARLGPALGARDGYAYLDRAYFLNDAFSDAPPDYEFDYGEEAPPWAWRTDDGYIRIVEPLAYGDRYYYYQPGDDYPFLIRDPDFAYGYADGELVALYNADGALLPPEDLPLHATIAGRELARGEAIFSRAGSDRQPVAVASWTSRRSQITNDVRQWRQQVSHQAGWRTYHQANLATEQAHWAPERYRREAETARVDRQIHDPDGAQRALRSAGQAQADARKAGVQIALLPHRGQAGQTGPGAAETRLATIPGQASRGPEAAPRLEAAHPRRDLATLPDAARVQGPPAADAPPGRLAAERKGPDRLAMASGGPEGRALYDVKAHGPDHGPAASAGPHLRAAEQVRAAQPLGPPHGQPQGQPHFARAPETPHVQVAQAQHEDAPHVGGPVGPNPGSGGGGHNGGGGQKAAAAAKAAGGNGGHPGGPPKPDHKDHGA